MSAKDLSKANVGDTVELLWRDELSTPFSRRSIFGDDGKPISGKCIATRFAGGWRMADSGDSGGKGTDEWTALDNDESECMANTFSADGCMYYMPCDAGNAPTTPAGAAAARPKKKLRTGAASLKDVYR